jgi:hypothetical protein
MDELFQEFIKSCLELGEELLEKESLTEKERKFITNLDLLVDKKVQI